MAQICAAWDLKPMESEDPFVAGLRRVIADTEGMTVARLSKMSGLDISTIRKLTSGASSTPKHTTMLKVAATLGLTVQQIIDQGVDGASPPRPASGRGHSTGFAEDATPFAAPGPDEAAAVRVLFRDAGRNVAITHKAAAWMPDLAIAPGDLILCDLSRLPEPGELVLVVHRDEVLGHSTSLIRRYLPPWLVAAGPPGGAPPTKETDPEMHVMNPIVGVIRAGARKQEV